MKIVIQILYKYSSQNCQSNNSFYSCNSSFKNKDRNLHNINVMFKDKNNHSALCSMILHKIERFILFPFHSSNRKSYLLTSLTEYKLGGHIYMYMYQ